MPVASRKPRTKRAQVLMEPREYRRLEAIARQTGVSVAELIRSAVQDRYLQGAEGGREALEDLFAMSIPLGGWRQLEEEIADSHDAGLP